MNRCETYERLISERVDRPLTPAEHADLSAHLSQCVTCREFAASVESQRHAVKSLPLFSASGQSQQPIQQGAGMFTRLWKMRLSIPLPVAAVIGLVVLGAAYWSMRGARDQVIDSPASESTITYVQVEVVPASSAKPLTLTAPSSKE